MVQQHPSSAPLWGNGFPEIPEEVQGLPPLLIAELWEGYALAERQWDQFHDWRHSGGPEPEQRLYALIDRWGEAVARKVKAARPDLTVEYVPPWSSGWIEIDAPD
ncbi:MAG: hypothetical protein WA979_04835 [Pacificimonas sp.]